MPVSIRYIRLVADFFIWTAMNSSPRGVLKHIRATKGVKTDFSSTTEDACTPFIHSGNSVPREM